jgi:hypothetical protein
LLSTIALSQLARRAQRRLAVACLLIVGGAVVASA